MSRSRSQLAAELAGLKYRLERRTSGQARRALETRQKAIVGAAVLYEAARDERAASSLRQILREADLSDQDKRALALHTLDLGLWAPISAPFGRVVSQRATQLHELEARRDRLAAMGGRSGRKLAIRQQMIVGATVLNAAAVDEAARDWLCGILRHRGLRARERLALAAYEIDLRLYDVPTISVWNGQEDVA